MLRLHTSIQVLSLPLAVCYDSSSSSCHRFIVNRINWIYLRIFFSYIQMFALPSACIASTCFAWKIQRFDFFGIAYFRSRFYVVFTTSRTCDVWRAYGDTFASSIAFTVFDHKYASACLPTSLWSFGVAMLILAARVDLFIPSSFYRNYVSIPFSIRFFIICLVSSAGRSIQNRINFSAMGR